MIAIDLPYPVSANRYWRTAVIGRRVSTYLSAEAKAFKVEAALIARSAGMLEPVKDDVMLSLTIHPVEPKDAAARLRKHGAAWHRAVRCLDIDNCIKVTLDALQGVCYVDDDQVVALRIDRGMPVPQGRLSVEVSRA